MAEKKCRWCITIKPIEDFYTHPRMADGHLNKCKECVKAAVNVRYYRKHDEVMAYERDRFRRPERKAKVIEYQKNSRAGNPQKHAARTAVGNAIRDGRLLRQPCEICGDAKSQAHHEDYSKPLDVRWLCFRCHREHGHGQTVTAA